MLNPSPNMTAFIIYLAEVHSSLHYRHCQVAILTETGDSWSLNPIPTDFPKSQIRGDKCNVLERERCSPTTHLFLCATHK